MTLIWATRSQAALLQFSANLDGLQEVPPNASPAYGSGQFTLDTLTGAVTVTEGSYRDLLGGATAVSLCGPASPGVNAPFLLTLTLDTPGAATGTFSGGGVLSAGNVTDMTNGLLYVNIRSQVFPSGEIRGQLLAVPEPAAALLGLAGLALIRHRRS